MSTSTPVYAETRHLKRLILAWDDRGIISEAHTTWCTVVTRDGAVLAKTDDLAPLVVGDGSAANLEAVLTELHVSSIATIQGLQSSLRLAEGDRDVAKSRVDALTTETTKLKAEKESLAAEVEALRAEIASASTKT